MYPVEKDLQVTVITVVKNNYSASLGSDASSSTGAKDLKYFLAQQQQ